MPFVTVDGIRLEYRMIAGDAAATPVVLLHEGLGSAGLWRDFPDKLAGRLGARTIAYSRRGYGQSDPLGSPRTPRFMLEEAEALARVLESFHLERPLLIGHSDGASIALIHAALGHRPVAGLVLIAPHVFVEDVTLSSIARIRDSYGQGDLKARLARHHAHVDDAFHGWADTWLAPEFRSWSLDDLLPRIDVPILLIQGARDEYGTLEQLDRIQRAVKGATTRLVLSGAGHAPHRESDGEVIAAIARFAAGLAPSAATAARHAQQRTEARFTAIVTIAADAIISIDEAQRITLFNHGAEVIFGYKQHEVLGEPLDMLLPDRYRSAHAGHVRGFAATGPGARRMGERAVVYGRRKSGEEFPAEASISHIEVGGEHTFTVLLRDVTEHKNLEAMLERRVAERTAELSAIIDAVPDGIFTATLDRRIRTVNAAMAALFGYGRDEFTSMSSAQFYESEADDALVLEAWKRWSGPGAKEAVTVTCRRKDGSTFTAHVLGNLVRDQKGEVLGRVGVVRDITQELSRQKALTEAQRMEAFGQLTGGIAHDFNNLLTVISGNLEMLEMRLEDERQKTLAKRAIDAAEMGARLTSRLLTFARRRRFATRVIDLNEQVMGMADLLRRTLGEDIDLTTLLAPRLWGVKADASEVENAVLNLAINSRDAMPKGGKLVVTTANVTVTAGSAEAEGGLAPGEYVRLSIADTGVGMTAEVRERAFEPFFTTKPTGRGTGLGLATIYGFVRELGGSVTIESEPGQGATVNLYLPRSGEAAEPAKAGEREAPLPVSAGETVLLVEDNAEVRHVASGRLARLGYKVIEAANGPAALAVLEAGTAIDAVFSDIVMAGGLSGFDVARWVRIHRPGLPLLLTTGYADERLKAGAMDLADVKVLFKPYDLAALARALREVIEAAV